jgi:hypothetical protein
MKLGKFEQPDYLAIGPFCWGRSKTPAEAWRAMKANFPGAPYAKADAECALYRLTDATDTVNVDMGYFTVDSGEKPYLCGKFPANYQPGKFPAVFEVPAEDMAA